jgi:uncharacterized protein (TIGR02996 family)
VSARELEDYLHTWPDDPESWRVYADFLLERGDERGRLIQLELDLEREEEPQRREVLAVERVALERALHARWQERWVPPLFSEVAWERGFVRDLFLSGEGAVAALRAFFSQPEARLLDRLTVSCLPDEDLAEFLELLGQIRVRTLSLDVWDETIAVHPSLRSLTSLDLAHALVDAEGAAVLAASEPLDSLTSLSLRLCPLGDGGALALARSPHLRSLRILSLEGTDLGPRGVEALACSELLRSVALLGLSRNAVGDEGALALARSPYLGSLARLELAHAGLGPEGVRALASSEGLRHLVEIDLEGNTVGDEGALALAHSSHLPSLKELTLGWGDLEDEGQLALEQRAGLRLVLMHS